MAESDSFASPEFPSADAEPRFSGFQSPKRHAKILQALLLILIGISALIVAAFLVTIQAFDRVSDAAIPSTIDQLVTADERRALLGRFFLGLSLVYWIALIVWTRRMYRNLTPLGATSLRYSEGWAVGAFFVPFLNLWRPKAIINDIWRASDPQLPAEAGDTWKPSSRVDPVLDAWWIALLASSAVYIAFAGNDPDLVPRSFFVWGAVAFVTQVIVATLLLWTVTRLTRRQLLRADALIPSRAPGLGFSHNTGSPPPHTPRWRIVAFPVLATAVATGGFLIWTQPNPVTEVTPSASEQGLVTYSGHGVDFDYPNELRAQEFGIFADSADVAQGMVMASTADQSIVQLISWFLVEAGQSGTDLLTNVLNVSFEEGLGALGPSEREEIAESTSHGGLLLVQSWSMTLQGELGYGVISAAECESGGRIALIQMVRLTSAGGSPERTLTEFQTLVDSLHC